MLYTPERHEPLADERFTQTTARRAIERIVARADVGGMQAASLDWGAAGVAWALAELGAVVERELVEGLEERLRTDRNDPDYGEEGVWFGVAGVLAVAEHLWPDAARRDRLFDLARESLASPALEPMVGHPGFMALAAQLRIRTGEERWAGFWRAGEERLLDAWEKDAELDAWLWTQRLGGHDARYLGAAHGLVANAHVLRRGGNTDADVRTIPTLSRLAVVEDGRANWPPVAGEPLVANNRIRVQWCHGAPGVLTAMWDAAPDDDSWTALLLAAGRLVWEAGPIRDDPGLCHGTAGNAYALLALWRRTGDELWLERARAFAAHAAAQVERRPPQHSLYTGDEGVALCLASCLAGDAELPVADRLISPA